MYYMCISQCMYVNFNYTSYLLLFLHILILG